MPGTSTAQFSSQFSFAPVTFMGQAAWESTTVTDGPFGLVTSTEYVTLTNDRACTIAKKDEYGTFVYPTPDCTPLDMKPGDSVDWPGYTRSLPTTPPSVQITHEEHRTFIGFETVTVNGKTFSNACHIKRIEGPPDDTMTADTWFAEGKTIRDIAVSSTTTATMEFKRDL